MVRCDAKTFAVNEALRYIQPQETLKKPVGAGAAQEFGWKIRVTGAGPYALFFLWAAQIRIAHHVAAVAGSGSPGACARGARSMAQVSRRPNVVIAHFPGAYCTWRS